MLYTLFYTIDQHDTCNSKVDKRDLVIQQLTFNDPLQPILPMTEYHPTYPDVTLSIRQRKLNELMDMLPVDLPYQNNHISFGLKKKINHNSKQIFFECFAFFTDEYSGLTHGVPTWHDDTTSAVKFTSEDPCIAVSMMIGWTKTDMLQSIESSARSVDQSDDDDDLPFPESKKRGNGKKD